VGEDEDRIRRTLSEYSQRCDDGRYDEWSQLFTEDARFVVSGTEARGRPAIRDLMTRMLPPGQGGKHITSNTLVDIDGDTATSTTDYLFVRPTGAGPTIVAAGRYHDQLARDGVDWKFRLRSITMLDDPGDASGD